MPPQDKARRKRKRPQNGQAYSHWQRTEDESAVQMLTPSEGVLLNAGQFAARVPKDIGILRDVPRRTLLLDLFTAVSTSELLVAAISVAFLAKEHNGEVKLIVQKGGTIWARDDRLIIKRAGASERWPQGSLESRIGDALATRATTLWPNNTGAELIRLMVNGTFWEWLFNGRHSEPYLLGRAVEALVMRGIADIVPDEDRLRRILPPRRIWARLSEYGQRAVEQYHLEEVWQLLSRCKRERPAIWSLLKEEIEYGLARADSSANSGD